MLFKTLVKFWLCWVFVAVYCLSVSVVSWGYSLPVVHRLLVTVASLAAEQGLWNV